MSKGAGQGALESLVEIMAAGGHAEEEEFDGLERFWPLGALD